MAVDYTPAQARLYIEASWRAEKRRQHNTLWLLHAAQADDKWISKALESLEE